MDTRLAEMAEQHGAKPSAVRAYYEQQGMLAELRNEIVEGKVCEFLRENARIAEESPEGSSDEEAAAEDA